MSVSAKEIPESEADHVDIRPMSVHIGAEIFGVDLRQPLSAAEVGSDPKCATENGKVVFFQRSASGPSTTY